MEERDEKGGTRKVRWTVGAPVERDADAVELEEDVIDLEHPIDVRQWMHL
jgi:hypothetical protein